MKSLSFSIEKLCELLKDACSKETIYWTDQKKYPETEDLVTTVERDEIVSFLLEVCDREEVAFSIETFSLFVILLDRFLANYKVKSKYLECLAVACFYIASKVKEEDENVSITSEFLMDCDAKCTLSELLRMELMVLTKFEWNVNNVTHADFLHIYHSIVVNKYNETEKKLNEEQPKKFNIWKNKHAKSFKLDTEEEAIVLSKFSSSPSSYLNPPENLDFLDLLESQLKQILCINELTTTFRPHLIAYCLLEIQIDEFLSSKESQNCIFNMKSTIIDAMNLIKQCAKLNDDILIESCKELVQFHLSSIQETNNLFDKYLNDYHSGIVKSFRTSLSTVNNASLPAIKEEEEIEECCVNNNSNLLGNILNNFNKSESIGKINSIETPCDLINKYLENFETDMDKFDSYKKKSNIQLKGLSYADILVGRTSTLGKFEQQKRKLSENSSISSELTENNQNYDDFFYYEDDEQENDDGYDQEDDYTYTTDPVRLS